MFRILETNLLTNKLLEIEQNFFSLEHATQFIQKKAWKRHMTEDEASRMIVRLMGSNDTQYELVHNKVRLFRWDIINNRSPI